MKDYFLQNLSEQLVFGQKCSLYVFANKFAKKEPLNKLILSGKDITGWCSPVSKPIFPLQHLQPAKINPISNHSEIFVATKL